ncbi:type II toxin-antitoxin system Y4mF family antitoxin [Bartonella sp. F02]|uniref:type II toxin-antitoxin system Y4mF family antitoxin n=1 Tax=Bartonella sp. F02 TaxID=2967262 RepID=UPI0022A904EC|nr:type II toxin-antitoxin system Y4mF family antitoxin [Bartonella sp. F02]MCZ2328958.1 type II toxin-antitoxin system Y4mF family antitoxin [Bartonella sp. F02]
MIQSRTKTLGLIVRDVRKQQKLTQEQLAATSGVGVRFIRDLERGKESCQIEKTLNVLATLGIDIQIKDKKL